MFIIFMIMLDMQLTNWTKNGLLGRDALATISTFKLIKISVPMKLFESKIQTETETRVAVRYYKISQDDVSCAATPRPGLVDQTRPRGSPCTSEARTDSHRADIAGPIGHGFVRYETMEGGGEEESVAPEGSG